MIHESGWSRVSNRCALKVLSEQLTAEGRLTQPVLREPIALRGRSVTVPYITGKVE